MRIPIAFQLALLVLLTSLLGIAVLAIATWITTYDFVVGVGSQGLELVASIKAGQISSNLDLLETTCKTISTRLLVQSSLRRYNGGNRSDDNWVYATTDLQSALGNRGFLALYQAVLFPKNGSTGQQLLKVTSDSTPAISLPYNYSNGTSALLGSSELGYPPSLYPNISYTSHDDTNSTTAFAFPDYTLGLESSLLLGPLTINESFSLVSLTLPIVNNTSDTDLLGFITIVASATSVQNVISSRDGLGSTGQALLIGPSRPENRFAATAQPATSTSPPDSAALANAEVRYIFEPTPLPDQKGRHGEISTNTSFPLSRYAVALEIMREPYEKENITISHLSTTNEAGASVAVGAVRPQSSLAQWILVVEELHSEAFAPVTRLRKIILACVFGTAGVIIATVPLLATWAVAPIRRLRDAAQKSVTHQIVPPPSPHSSRRDITGSISRVEEIGNPSDRDENSSTSPWTNYFKSPLERLKSSNDSGKRNKARSFQIPGRVKERRNCVTDELTELTRTFNEMSDELTIQYSRLEQRVAERTQELEKAKKTAENANESKTLFIANLSHELKTPLNGILGMCAVCMGEDDLSKIKTSLQVVYQSGDLLLHLLNDLLTFSKNQIEQAIQLEEKEFKLSDIRSQLAIIFQNQVHEKKIDFSINCMLSGMNSQPGRPYSLCYEQNGGSVPAGKFTDLILWGDQHRLLQVLINLVSNSLKFTPENGKVEVRIQCLEGPLLLDNQPGSEHVPKQSMEREASQNLSEKISQRNSTDQSALKTLIFQFDVEDNGPGIPAHLHRRIFDPFVQGDLGLNRKYGGTGLGLSIVSQLSRILNGSISVDSKEGRGSIFSLQIPFGLVKEVASSTHNSSAPGSRTPSVLSLDDFSNTTRPVSNHESLKNESTAPGFDKSEIQPRLVGLSQPFFTPTVPSSPTSSGSKSARPSESLAGRNAERKVRVLVAEDNTVNQEVVRRMLALEEVYDVTMVKDGQEAFDTVKLSMEKGLVFDLIFMDIQMPNLDGLQSTRLIRQIGYSRPIVALSAFAEESNVKDCLGSGMDMFISKPIRRPALKQVLNKFAIIPEE